VVRRSLLWIVASLLGLLLLAGAVLPPSLVCDIHGPHAAERCGQDAPANPPLLLSYLDQGAPVSDMLLHDQTFWSRLAVRPTSPGFLILSALTGLRFRQDAFLVRLVRRPLLPLYRTLQVWLCVWRD